MIQGRACHLGAPRPRAAGRAVGAAMNEVARTPAAGCSRGAGWLIVFLSRTAAGCLLCVCTQRTYGEPKGCMGMVWACFQAQWCRVRGSGGYCIARALHGVHAAYSRR